MKIKQADLGMPVPTKAEKAKLDMLDSVDSINVDEVQPEPPPPSAVRADLLRLLPGFGSTVEPDYANALEAFKQNLTSVPEESAINSQSAKAIKANNPAPKLNRIAMDYLSGHGMTQDLAFSLGYHMGQQKQVVQGQIPVSIQPEVCEVNASSPDRLLISDPRIPPSVDPRAFAEPEARMLPEIVRQLNAQDDTVPGQPSTFPKRKRKRRNKKKDEIGFARIRNSKRIKVQTLSWNTGTSVLYRGRG